MNRNAGATKKSNRPSHSQSKRATNNTRLPAISPNGKKRTTVPRKGKSENLKKDVVIVTKTPVVIIASPKKLTVREEAEKLLAEDERPDLNGTGFIRVRFNHYNKPFPIHNGVLRWACVDEEYCISFVFRGNYTRDLRQELEGEGRDIKLAEDRVRRDEKGDFFLGLVADSSSSVQSGGGDGGLVTYRLVLEEDPEAGVGAEGLRIREGPLSINKEAEGVQSGNKAVNDITKSLLNMKTSELHSQEANDLRERRDLEDILYS